MKLFAFLLSGVVALGVQSVSAETRGVTDDTIKIGTVTDLSGPLASWGVAATNGQRMRYEEVNENGGINSRKIDFIVEDMQYQIPMAVQAAAKLMTSDEVFAFVANLGTPPNNAIMKRTLDAGFPYIFPLSAGLSMSEPAYPLKKPYLLNDRDTMRGAVRYFAETKGVKKICYQVMANDYGTEVESGIKMAAETLGLEITAFGRHKPTETEFTAAVLQLRNSGCEALFIGSVSRDATQIYTTVRGAGWDVPVISSLGSLVPPVAENAAMEGFYTAAPFHLIDFEGAKDSAPHVYEWYQDYKARFGANPSAQAVIGYTMADVTVKALEKAGKDLTVDSFIAAFDSIESYNDPFGGPEVSFKGATHYGAQYSVLSQVRDGKWVVVSQSLPF
ncbi:ABC transporter substrate-binding protein [Oceanibacterium hippocampi]|uniref:Leucine-, isoleucine-, valine-, threonine-, and alanine-binding protein n=1 Tax=Oceanibacterium hippocampi TaxID=745714 RepID=A0A1Y5STR8_9PROT|nr:ABC transporter substrate-binding protein [Oceanibacterium hippocampi]SLN46748.1 Leucine-, isoleucine-, valine-, threonine-, and alanine-binding protein precursor [Oceanibacterium hippocampi]